MMKPNPSRGTKVADENQQLLQGQARDEPVAVTRWRAAERRLYPLIMVDADLYKTAVTLVHEAAQVLSRECGTVAELTHVDAAGVLAQCPSTALATSSGFDPGTALDAARAHRFRDLAAREPDAGPEPRQGGQP
ncbi:hypothetical protein [Terrabacter sp. MAHUQ-38]|uniref:hypothetical protein n=1 Tax=unclassified Terrabacter TaxID=2630222 RepID=UPI00165DF86E|nr:hypothetical protein [Terrabacter sp. MAHUQ-38]MBC9822899.1 hypothetical protein [Terrabacter sp. MAHUQ-38]